MALLVFPRARRRDSRIRFVTPIERVDLATQSIGLLGQLLFSGRFFVRSLVSRNVMLLRAFVVGFTRRMGMVWFPAVGGEDDEKEG